jgi:DNA-binding response OmpR family regulator
MRAGDLRIRAPHLCPPRMIKSILVVAPDSPGRGALIARLEREGYLVVSAAERAQAREILGGLVPGAVYVDLSMPRRQGRLLVADLDGDRRLRMVPRLVEMSALRPNTRPVSGGAVFVKPIDLEHVIRTLRAVYPAAPPAQARRPRQLEREDLALLAS